MYVAKRERYRNCVNEAIAAAIGMASSKSRRNTLERLLQALKRALHVMPKNLNKSKLLCQPH